MVLLSSKKAYEPTPNKRQLVVSGFSPVPGSGGFDRSVSADLHLSHGIGVGPSSVTISVPPRDNHRCNNAVVGDEDESVARIP